MTYEEWAEQYRPIDNPITDEHGYEGKLFETYGDELDAVRKAWEKSPNTVWTIVESDGYSTLTAGYHYVNRMGYFITEEAFYNEDIEIQLGDPSDFDSDDHCINEDCTNPVDDGEGYDGYCGNCADARERAS